MSNISNITRNVWMLKGTFAKRGYGWWWHSLTAVNNQTLIDEVIAENIGCEFGEYDG